MTKRYISVLLAVVFSLSAFGMAPVAFAENNTYAAENFNGYITGDIPHTALEARAIGDASVAVCDTPSLTDKSVLIRNEGSGSVAFLQHSFLAARNDSVGIDFDIYIPAVSHELFLPEVIDSAKTSFPLLKIKDGSVFAGDIACGAINQGEWNSMSVELNTENKIFYLTINGDSSNVISGGIGDIADISKIRFGAGSGQKFYLDNLFVYKGTAIKSSNSDIPSINEYSETSPILLNQEKQAVFSDMTRGRLVVYAGSPYVLINGTKSTFNAVNDAVVPKVEGDDILVPLRFIAESYGYTVLWEADTGSVCIAKDTKTAKFTLGSSLVDNNGVMLTAPAATANIGGSTYASVTALAQVFGKELYIDGKLAILGDGNPFETNEQQLLKQELINNVKYMRPDAKTILQNLSSEHPRVMATKADFDTIKSLITTDDFANKMYNYVKTTADSYLSTTPAEYSLKETYRMGDCRDTACNIITTLSFMWQVSGNEDYALRCAEELAAICTYPHWHQGMHYLDTGVMLSAAAIGYDWMYEYLSANNPSLLETLRNMMLENGLLDGIEILKGISQYGNVALASSWPTTSYNWNPVCNGGVIMSALALADEIEPAVTGTAIELSLRSFEYVCNEFAPDGAWEEGPAYWNETIDYFVYILSTLETALGTDFGYSNAEGILDTCYYPVYIMGPNGTFNYSDSATTLNVESPHQFYWSDKLADKDLSYLRKKQITKNNYRCEYTDLLWYEAENCGTAEPQYSLDRKFGKVETATMRSSWDDNALFLGFHSGNSNFGSHAHLDTGSFILDQNNVRWFEDLGTDRVTYTSASGFTAYRKRAEGHNTLVMQSPDLFTTQKDADGNLGLLISDFDNLSEGDAPVGVNVSTAGSGRAYVTEDDNGDGMHLLLSTDDAEKTTQSYIQKNFSNNPVQNRMIIKYKFMREDMSADNSVPSLRSAENSVGMLVLTKTGKMRVYDGDDAITLREYETGKWYDVEIDVDLVNQIYDITVIDELGDEVKAEGYKLRNTLDSITLFRIQLYAQISYLHLDNLEIWIDPVNELITQRKELDDQNRTAYCCIDEFETGDKAAYVVSDITEAYRDWASSAVRGVGLFDNRRVAVIRDEIKLKDSYDIYWFAHTKADITVSEDGKSAILEKDGKRLWAGIIDGSDGKFEVMEAAPFATSPDPAGQIVNSDYKKLTVFLDDVTEANIAVAFTALTDGQTEPDTIASVGAISTWNVPDGNILKPDSITVDGVLIENFNPNTSSYSVYAEKGTAVPVVAATASDATVTVVQASGIPGCATITLTDATGSSVDYNIYFYEKIVNYSTIDGHQINSELVSASSEPEAHNPAVATLDGSLDTAWASNGMAEWIMYDLGSSKPIDCIQLAWRKGDQRAYKFKILLSDDGASWTTVYEGESSGTTLALEPHSFTETNGRFIRVECYGSTYNTWNNITEIR